MTEDVPVRYHEIPEVDQTWSISRIVREAAPSGWPELFANAEQLAQGEENLPVDLQQMYEAYDEVSEDLADETFFPLKKDLFRAFHLTKKQDVKVVIVGQDPYFSCGPDGLPMAVGLSFSMRRHHGVSESMKNVYKEIKTSYSFFQTPDHCDLSYWAAQGVLLINSCLTVAPGTGASHKERWSFLIRRTIQSLMEHDRSIIFVLWGQKAQNLETIINGKCPTLLAAHPSGHSASRGFFGCGHFKQINEMLVRTGRTPIDWQV